MKNQRWIFIPISFLIQFMYTTISMFILDYRISWEDFFLFVFLSILLSLPFVFLYTFSLFRGKSNLIVFLFKKVRVHFRGANLVGLALLVVMGLLNIRESIIVKLTDAAGGANIGFGMLMIFLGLMIFPVMILYIAIRKIK